MSRRVLLPMELSNRLEGLTAVEQETNGVLLYRPHGADCPIESIFMTGIGDEGHVQSTEQRMAIVNEFFRRNADYQFVKFHTHTKGTIRRFGPYYAQHFSSGDIQTYKEQLRQDSRFIAMLVTPETKLLCGMDNPVISVVQTTPAYNSRKEAIPQALRVIARNLGYSLENLRGSE